jgi:hypothetical protein
MSATICFPMTSRSGLDSPTNVSASETRIVDRKLHPSTLGSLSSLSAALLDLLPCARVFAQTPSAGTISDHDFHIHDPFHPSLPLHSPSPNKTSESSTIFNNVPCACISIPHASTATASIYDNAPGSPPDRGGVAEIYGIYTGSLPCSIIAGIYSGCLPRSVVTGICSGYPPCSVTELASRCRCAPRSQPTLSHLPDMPQHSDLRSTSAVGSMPYFAPHYR